MRLAAHRSSPSPWAPVPGEEARHGEAERDVLTFTVGGEVYGLDIGHIREIIKNRPITEVPRVPAFIAGIIAVRGVVMPVIDLRVRLRLNVVPLSPRARILVAMPPAPSSSQGADGGQEPVGLLVDCVHHVVRLQEGDIEPPTMLSGYEMEFVAGIGRVPREEDEPPRAQGWASSTGMLAARERDMIILLDLSRVLTFEAAHGLEEKTP